MSIYEYVDPTADEATALFWSLVPVVAEQAGVTAEDAVFHMRRAWADRLKAIRTHQGIDFRDDGRAAAWRVRLTIWRIRGTDDQQECVADTDPQLPFERDGATIIYGLGAVSAWVRELCAQAHPTSTLEGLSEATLANKLKSLRVALSTQHGSCIWRLRYSAAPIAATPSIPAEAGAGPVNRLKELPAHAHRLDHLMAHVRVTREESPRFK